MPQALDRVEDGDKVLIIFHFLWRGDSDIVDRLLKLVESRSNRGTVGPRSAQENVARLVLCRLKIVENVAGFWDEASDDGVIQGEWLRHVKNVDLGCVGVSWRSVSGGADDWLESVEWNQLVVDEFTGETSGSSEFVADLKENEEINVQILVQFNLLYLNNIFI